MKITERLKIMLKSILSLQMGEVKTDKAVLIWDGEGELEAGMEVFVEGEDGEYAPAADGEYITEDYAICVNKSNTELLKQINEALAALKADGTLDRIIAKYINDGSSAE